MNLKDGIALVFKLATLGICSHVVCSVVDATKKDLIVAINIATIMLALIMVYNGPVKEALAVAESFMEMID